MKPGADGAETAPATTVTSVSAPVANGTGSPHAMKPIPNTDAITVHR